MKKLRKKILSLILPDPKPTMPKVTVAPKPRKTEGEKMVVKIRQKLPKGTLTPEAELLIQELTNSFEKKIHELEDEVSRVRRWARIPSSGPGGPY